MERRTAIFWGVCIPSRVALTLVARQGSPPVRLYAAVAAYQWLSGSVDNSVGMFGGPVWWADERPLHGLLFALYAATDDWRWLALDTSFGAFNWLREARKS